MCGGQIIWEKSLGNTDLEFRTIRNININKNVRRKHSPPPKKSKQLLTDKGAAEKKDREQFQNASLRSQWKGAAKAFTVFVNESSDNACPLGCVR